VRNLLFGVSVSGGLVCWNCAEPISDSLFCPSCQSLQQPPSDYYRVLGLEPPRLNLDADDLQRRFYELSRRLHPDRFMRKPELERRYSLDATSILNDAYRTLRDPVRRALYVLKQQGFDVGEQRGKDVPPELLEEVFELNMALEEMREGDVTARPQLEAAQKNFGAMMQAADSELKQQFAAWDAAPDSEKLSRIRGVLNRRKYIQNLVDEVQSVLAA
jgi:molecular chaperone HscB